MRDQFETGEARFARSSHRSVDRRRKGKDASPPELATELSSLLGEAPKLKALLGPELLSFGRWEGKQWAVPAKRTLVARTATFIRKDWLDKLGMKLPETRNDWYNALVAFRTRDPGATGGKVIPYEFSGVDIANTDWNAQTLLPSFLKPMSAEDRAVYGGTARWVQPGYKDGVKFLNKLYNENLLGHDFPLDKDGKQYQKDVAQGLVGSVIHNWDDPYRANPGLQGELAKNVKGGLYVAIDPFTNWAGLREKPKYNPNGFYIFVPSYSRNAVAAIKYLEWMADPAVYGFLTNGTKGVHYTDEVDGIPVNYKNQTDLTDNQKTNWTDFAIILNGKEFGSDAKNAKAAALGSSYSPGYGPQLEQAYLVAMKDALFPIHWEVILDAEAKYSGQLNQKSAEIWVKCISAKPAEFDALYDSMVKEWLSMGGQAVIDEKRAAYQAMTGAK